MWNMSDSDKRYYDNQERRDKKRKNALDMAKARGEAAEKWFKDNTLTKESQPEFNMLMKQTDKDFKNKL